MKLALVISSLHTGGSERALSTLANGFASHGDEVVLITLASRPSTDRFELGSGVRRKSIGDASPSSGRLAGFVENLKRVVRLRAALAECQPRCVIAFGDQTNVVAILASRWLGLPVIVSERTDPDAYDMGGQRWEFLRRVAYPRADAVVFQTEDVADRFIKNRTRVAATVIANPLPNDVFVEPPATGSAPEHRQRVVALGRLAREKGFDLLIEAFARIADRHPKWDLCIFGDGGDRAILESRCRELGLDQRIRLPGRTSTPFSELVRSDLFVLPSRFEGMPNAMLEAMALGVPVVAFDCRSGPREISNDGRNALLVPPADPEALAEAMDRVMTDQLLRQTLGRAGLQVRRDFHPSRIIGQWRALIESVVR